jgi:hypothetical protein
VTLGWTVFVARIVGRERIFCAHSSGASVTRGVNRQALYSRVNVFVEKCECSWLQLPIRDKVYFSIDELQFLEKVLTIYLF